MTIIRVGVNIGSAVVRFLGSFFYLKDASGDNLFDKNGNRITVLK